MKLPFRVTCIHDEDRPNDIPTSKWVVKGQEYTVIKVERMQMHGGMLGYELEEIDLEECCFPYTRFAAWRFAIDLSLFSYKYNYQNVPTEEELEFAER